MSKQCAVIERTYKAHVEDLWDLWTTKEGIESWWGPEGARTEVRTIEARPGGALHYDVFAETPELIAALEQMGLPRTLPVRARFTEIERHERVTLAEVIDFVPGVKPYEATITAEFFTAGESVRMVVTLEPGHDEDFTQKRIMGCTSQLAKLTGLFAEEPEGII